MAALKHRRNDKQDFYEMAAAMKGYDADGGSIEHPQIGTPYDAKDMDRLGKKQQLKVSVLANEPSVTELRFARETSASSRFLDSHAPLCVPGKPSSCKSLDTAIGVECFTEAIIQNEHIWFD
jgi:hypothetical protein